MSQEEDRPSAGEAFVFTFDDTRPSKAKVRVPERFRKTADKTKLTQEMLAEKQRKAEQRRKAVEEERLDRVRLVHDQCLRINQAAESLLAQDALRRNQVDPNNVKPMNRRQIKQQINQLETGFKKLEEIGKTKLSYDYQDD